ncbi:MAG TPA: lantibiotic dehydratase [Acidimicrobiales bacterium]
MTAVLDTRPAPATDAGAPRWERLPAFVLRMAGFPFGWLGDLADGTTAAATGGLLVARARVAAAVAAGRQVEAAGRDDQRALRALRQGRPPGPGAVGRASPAVAAAAAELADAVDRCTDAERAVGAAYERECGATGAAATARFRDDPALQDMLLVSNESSYRTILAWLAQPCSHRPNARNTDRKQLDALVRYLQRVCAKNDTTSHFGPLMPGRFDPDLDGVAWRPGRLERAPLLSRWAADELGARLGADPAVLPGLRPRRTAGAFLCGDVLRVVELHYAERRVTDVRRAATIGPEVRLDAGELAVLHAVDGDRTVADLARRTGRPLDETVAALRRLEAAGAVVVGPDIPYGTEDPLAHLRSLLDGDGDGDLATATWRDHLDAFAADVAAFAAGDTPERSAALARLKGRFETVTGSPADRTSGGFYSDRTVVNEQCLWAADDLRVGAGLLDGLAGDLAAVYDLFLLRPRHRLVAERALLASWFDERFAGEGEVGVDRYLDAFLADLDDLEPAYRQVDAEVDAVGDLVESVLLPDAGATGPVHRVDPAVVDRVVGEHGADVPAVCNPDVMLLAASPEALAAGDVDALIGEIHATEENLSHGSFAPFLDARFPGLGEEVVARYRALLDEDEDLADVTQFHRNRTWVRTALPCHEVEAVDRSPHPRRSVTPLHALTVCRSPAGLRLRSPSQGRFLRLTVAPLAWLSTTRNPFAVFSFPWSLGGLAVEGRGRDRLPRIQVGRVVVQRALWRVPVERLASGDKLEGFVAAQAVRHELGLPRHVFARVPGELKPVYCDLDSPLLLRQLTRMTATAGTGTVELGEMLPGPGQLWLRDERGAYTSEIRYAVFSGRGGAGGA